MNIPFTKKHHLFAALSLVALSSCGKQESTEIQDAKTPEPTKVASALVSNPSDYVRADEQQYFSYYDLGVSSQSVQLQAQIAQKNVPTQAIDVDADGVSDGIVVSVDLDAGATLALEIIEVEQTEVPPKRTQAEASHKTGGEWVEHSRAAENESYQGYQEYIGGEFVQVQELAPPSQYTDHSNWIRYEGPGIESDKVGYRIYLDARNGFDIFGKTKAEPVLQLVGQDGYESYHHMQDWGMDILKVGSSLGAGGFGRWTKQGLELVGAADQRHLTITNDGSIYSSFNIRYEGWQVDDRKVELKAEFGIAAGSRLVHTELQLSEAVGAMAIGIVKHEGTEFLVGELDIPGDTYTYLGSWGKQSLNDDQLGMAVIFRKRDFSDIVEDKSSYVAQMQARGNLLDYYFVAAWEGEHGDAIKTKEAFVAYLEQEAEKLTLVPRVQLKTQASQKHKKELSAESALAWSKALADSELERKTLSYQYQGYDVNRRRTPKFEYDIVGWLPLSYHRLGEALGHEDYKSVIQKVTSTFIGDDGSIHEYKQSNYNIDSVAPGSAVLQLYKDTGEEKYRLAADILREQLEHHPKTTEGAFWHKKKYESQLWLDGVFMGMPFLAEYSNLFEEGASYGEVIKEFELTRKYLRDPNTGLYYHGWDEQRKQVWADSETGLSPEFWARGMGWLAMATVDVLDFIPEDQAELRQPVRQMIEELATSLATYQDPDTGTWWQIMDKPTELGNYRESTATAMFSYFYAKALNKGYLKESEYRDTALKAYNGLINEFVLVHADGSISMTNQCLVAGLGLGRDGSYRYYMSEQIYNNDPKGTFPFILAGIEVNKLLED